MIGGKSILNTYGRLGKSIYLGFGEQGVSETYAVFRYRSAKLGIIDMMKTSKVSETSEVRFF
ncbi:hypothetical protein QUF72_21185 [Desulfobacterales bacterium HSG2]|nr:hypothetical protein [Desulfobacterales bacterium HSG2]